MKIELTLRNLSNLDAEYFVRELGLIQLDLQKDIHDTVEKYRKDRNVGMRVFNFIERTLNSGVENVDMLVSWLDGIRNVQFMQYEVLEHSNGTVRVHITLNEEYFELIEGMNNLPFAKKINRMIGTSRDKFVKEWHKTAKNYAGKHYTLDVIED